jgi:hypothetical protein
MGRVAILAATFPALALLALPVDGRADGPVAQSRVLSGGFARVKVAGPFEVTIQEGSPAAAVVTARAEIQEKVKVEVRGDTLVLEPAERPAWTWTPKEDRVEVAVTLPELRGLEVAGSGQVRAESGAAPRDLRLILAGSGSMEWKGTAAALDLSLSGSGVLRASGPSRSLAVAVSGSGEASYSGKTGPARIGLSGSGKVSLSGEGEALEASTSGSGDLEAADFPVRDAQVSIAGSGDMALRMAGGTLTARIAGSGKVVYRGEAKVESSVSGSGKVKRG